VKTCDKLGFYGAVLSRFAFSSQGLNSPLDAARYFCLICSSTSSLSVSHLPQRPAVVVNDPHSVKCYPVSSYSKIHANAESPAAKMWGIRPYASALVGGISAACSEVWKQTFGIFTLYKT
jgi:hypothetical protein